MTEVGRETVQGFEIRWCVWAPAIALLLTTGCAPPAPAPESLEIVFEARMGAEPAQCDVVFDGVGATETPVELADARFYVSNFSLLHTDGTWTAVELDQDTPWQHETVALLDFEDASGRCSDTGTRQMNQVVRGIAPAGSYSGLRFEIGVPHALNHLDASTSPSPLNLNALYWNWRFGYIFSKVEFWNPDVQSVQEPASQGTDSTKSPLQAASSAETTAATPSPRPTTTYLMHIGSTGCESASITSAPTEPCARPNRVPIEIDGFDPASDTVVLDLATLADSIDVTSSVPRPPGCMASPVDPDCIQVFANLGLDLATGRCTTDCSDQKLASRSRGE
ncbi:MAG: MbnP family copper-binding protein [Acidobacteriota bacterium]